MKTYIVQIKKPSDREELMKYGEAGNPTSLDTLLILKTERPIEKIRALPFVEEAHENVKLEHQTSEVEKVSAPNWILDDLTKRGDGEGVTIAVIDDGVRDDHVEFEGRATLGWAFDDKFYSVNDTHGTRVAGVALGKDIGVAPNATLEVYRTEMTLDQIVKSLDIALTKHKERIGNTVVNMSFVFRLPQMQSAFDVCKEHGMVLVGGAGNDGAEYTRWPASFKSVVGVGAYDEKRERSSFSNKAEIYAPGEGGRLARPTYTTAYYTNKMHTGGTSFSTPFVAGVLASLLPPYKITTAFEVDKVVEEMFKQSRDLGWGVGVDFKQQLESVEKPPAEEPPLEEPPEDTPEEPPVEEPPTEEPPVDDKKKKDKKKKNKRRRNILIGVVVVATGVAAYFLF